MPPMAALVLVLLMLAPIPVGAEEPADHAVHYEHGRLTVHATDVPLDRLLDEIAAATHATIRGGRPTRTGSFDFTARPLPEALSTILTGESFVLKYGANGEVRAIELLGRGEAPAVSAPSPSPAAPPPLAEEEAQAGVLQRKVEAVNPLARAVQSTTPTIGRVLHATTLDERPAVRAAAREVALAAFVRDPEIEAAYLSTLAPVDEGTLAHTLNASAAPGAVEEWMTALSTRAPSAALRAKAAAVLDALRR